MTDAAAFPVDSFRDAAMHLRRPFTPAAVKFKVQATWPTGGLIVAYIDARLVVERLNLIVPHLWFDEYEPTPKGLMWCRLTVDGIARSDIGEGVGKGLVSDALKRAAVKFGVGVSLYAIPKMMLKVADGHLKPKKGDSLELTPTGEKRVRSLYETWLKDHGTAAFGEPLDHGDSEDAQGDTEAESADPTGAPSDPPVEFVSEADIEELKAAGQGLSRQQVKLVIASLGVAATGWAQVPKASAADLAKALSSAPRGGVQELLERAS